MEEEIALDMSILNIDYANDSDEESPTVPSSTQQPTFERSTLDMSRTTPHPAAVESNNTITTVHSNCHPPDKSTRQRQAHPPEHRTASTHSNTNIRSSSRTSCASAKKSKTVKMGEQRFFISVYEKLLSVKQERTWIQNRLRRNAKACGMGYEEQMSIQWYDDPECTKYIRVKEPQSPNTLDKRQVFWKPVLANTGGKSLHNTRQQTYVTQGPSNRPIINNYGYGSMTSFSSNSSQFSDSGVSDTYSFTGSSGSELSIHKHRTQHQTSLGQSSSCHNLSADTSSDYYTDSYYSPPHSRLSVPTQGRINDSRQYCKTQEYGQHPIYPHSKEGNYPTNNYTAHVSTAALSHDHQTTKHKPKEIAVRTTEHSDTANSTNNLLVVYTMEGFPSPMGKRVQTNEVTTLVDFKKIIFQRKGHFRFFFKTFCADLNQEMLEELSTDDQLLPHFEGKIICHVEERLINVEQ